MRAFIASFRHTQTFLQYKNASQIKLLDELISVFDETKIPVLLVGGFALDFKLGRLTRPHSNVNLMIHSNQSSNVLEVMRKKKYLIRQYNETLSFLISKYSTQAEILFYSLKEDAALIQSRHRTVKLPADAFKGSSHASLVGIQTKIPNEIGLLCTTALSKSRKDFEIAQQLSNFSITQEITPSQPTRYVESKQA